MINPVSTKQVEDLQILILAEGRYTIDEYYGLTPWDLTTGSMTSVSVNPAGNYVAYT